MGHNDRGMDKWTLRTPNRLRCNHMNKKKVEKITLLNKKVLKLEQTRNQNLILRWAFEVVAPMLFGHRYITVFGFVDFN